MNYIQNPIIKGFNPDPSIISVDDDFYIATSTFEWFPGVQIHHSKDLANWELVTHPLDSTAKLDLQGVPDSCGVWAPCLSYHNGTFYLVYSNVKSFNGVWKDTPNYLITTNDIYGDWSDPIFLSASGFDGSLFHDDDGKKWYLSMLVDHRKGKFFGGIILQEYDKKAKCLIGDVYHIFEGTELGKTEGPHLYKRNGYYYLITAEGGTEYGHAVTIARSKSITGPYEVHPDNPLLTSAHLPQHPLQKVGHADLVWTSNEQCYIVYLTGRPLTTHGHCILGRETAIEEIVWKDDHWPYPKSGDKAPRLQIPTQLSSQDRNLVKSINQFETELLDINYASLRVPISEDWLSFNERPGYLRLKGRESLSSTNKQSLIARRLQSFHAEFSTSMEFDPQNFQQMCGLVCYYNTAHYYYLHISGGSQDGEKFLNLLCCDNYQTEELLPEPIPLPNDTPIQLKVRWDYDQLYFFYSVKGDSWHQLGLSFDSSILSDDYVRDGSSRYKAAFTGSFVGVCCQDLTGKKIPADFKWLAYKELLPKNTSEYQNNGKETAFS